jgi:two-component system chemotaxis response regulator CheB
MSKIRVLVVDDSALVRKLLTEILNADPDIEVVGSAMDPHFARDKIKELNPDVLTLDVEMPRMDGITFLRNLMRLRPMPVVMISTLTQKGADTTLEALELGAVDYVAKPTNDLTNKLNDFAQEIIAKVKVAAAVPKSVIERPRPALTPVDKSLVEIPAAKIKATRKIIAIGASTGGTEAIKEVLTSLPASAPSIVIAQHIPGAFSEAFANRVNGLSAMNVSQASDGEEILPGHVYIAPGDLHLKVRRSGTKYYCQLDDGPPVSRHKPSVDVLFDSVAKSVGKNAIGVMLTGMGSDGASGMLAMKEAGSENFVQDEASSVVWGMPGSAVKAGATDRILALGKIPEELVRLYSNE